MVVSEIYPDLQSSYRQHHRTETAWLKDMNDVLLKMNPQHVTLMVLLDLSAAFGTVDHDILLERLHRDVGIRGESARLFQLISVESEPASVHRWVAF